MSPYQQINLYQPPPRPPWRVLTLVNMGIAAAVVLAGLMAVYAQGYRDTQRVARQVEEASTQRQRAVARLAELQQQAARRTGSALLAAEIQRVEAAVARRRAILDAFESDRLGSPDGFSVYLRGLAERRVDGLWLTGVRIVNGGRDLELSGNALSPELVPLLIQELGREQAFSGLRFSELRLERKTGESGIIAFTLQTALAEAEAG